MFNVVMVFQTAWHFASACSLKFLHGDHNKDKDWIFKLNEICISNRSKANRYTDQLHSVCVRRVFLWRLLAKITKHVVSKIAYNSTGVDKINLIKIFYLTYVYMYHGLNIYILSSSKNDNVSWIVISSKAEYKATLTFWDKCLPYFSVFNNIFTFLKHNSVGLRSWE